MRVSVGHEKCVFATGPEHIQENDIDSSSTSFIEVTTSSMTGIAKVMGLQDMVASEVGRLLRISRVYLLTGKHTSGSDPGEPQEWEVKRNEEELEAAIRISKLGGQVVLFSGKRMWRLLPNPMVTQLDSRLPQLVLLFSSESINETQKNGDQQYSQYLKMCMTWSQARNKCFMRLLTLNRNAA